jgi:hypothetical protein
MRIWHLLFFSTEVMEVITDWSCMVIRLRETRHEYICLVVKHFGTLFARPTKRKGL